MVKPKKKEQWTLKLLRNLYSHHHSMYRKSRLMEEDRVPGLIRIEDVNARIAKEGLFFRDYD
jgi:hypothetical protein